MRREKDGLVTSMNSILAPVGRMAFTRALRRSWVWLVQSNTPRKMSSKGVLIEGLDRGCKSVLIWRLIGSIARVWLVQSNTPNHRV